jgi:hypothetical protein
MTPPEDTPETVEVGSGHQAKNRNQYPFDKLKKKGDFFLWPNRADDHALRQQAYRRKKSTGIDFRVTRDPKGVRVFHNGLVPKATRKPKK